ncbi:MAG: GAF domain-containing protein [Symploca sp. SIO1B1]|nr:GAF domain-containing protein [Symploca sp. SIO1C2]NER48726.1 GAF domain-containing protein [Symploca sp. SIO1A3]NER93914.1 GAF domain-containing protein [Symploca sp. SIO1B1]
MRLSQIPILTPENQAILQTSPQKVELVEQLLAIGTALSSSNDLGELLHLILSKSRDITYSDAGSVYLIDRDGDTPLLIFKVAQNYSIQGDTFEEFSMPLTHKSLAGYVALTGESLNLPDAYNLPPEVPFELDRSFDTSMPYRTGSVLVLPMQDQDGEVIGVLQLINRKVAHDIILCPEKTMDLTQPYSEWEERIVRSLASQAAISIERNHLQKSIENLFEGFVRASVQIIETRDSTTSGHSERVAELTMRLAQNTSAIATGPLKSIYLNDRQIREIRYAALLHDFGKVGVPEAILNKQKKLYPIQLEAIRHRLALAQRTLEMECAHKKFQHLLVNPSHQHLDNGKQGNCSQCQQLEQFDIQLAQAIDKLNQYWQLVKELNEPNIINKRELQASAEEILAQLTTMSEYTYQDLDGSSKPLITEEEIAQLMIARGNLTSKERLGIEAHVTHTYHFLERIPWTKHLKDVPKIAYGHHEKLDGSGYPLGLKQGEITSQTQMLTIADIYDALTASDRPYKRRLPTHIALKILREEATNNKINGDLVQLFEQSQVFTVLGHRLDDEE